MQIDTFIATDKEATLLNSKSSNTYFIFDILHVYLYVCTYSWLSLRVLRYIMNA